jgi:hypothetical protein
MKSVFKLTSEKRDSKFFGIELLSENEMLNVRGGVEKEKPRSRPKDAYDFEEE